MSGESKKTPLPSGLSHSHGPCERQEPDHLCSWDDYEKVRKVYSINIVYFELGQGGDYVYHGKTEFRGLHNPADILKLSARQNKKFFNIETPKPENRKSAGALFPEYYILRVNDFDKIATTPP